MAIEETLLFDGIDVSESSTIIDKKNAVNMINLLIDNPFGALNNDVGTKKQYSIQLEQYPVSIVQLNEEFNISFIDSENLFLWKNIFANFNNPFFADSSEYIYISDTDNHQIQVFDWNGNFIRKFGSFGSGNDNFNLPHGIKVFDNKLYIIDYLNSRIKITDLTGTTSGEISLLRAGETIAFGIDLEILTITGVDYIFATIAGIFNPGGTIVSFVRKYKTDGTFIQQYNVPELSFPSGITKDNDNNIYISSIPRSSIGTNGLIIKYDSSMTELDRFYIPEFYKITESDLSSPYNLKVYNGELFVSQIGRYGYIMGVYVYDLLGIFKRQIGKNATSLPLEYPNFFNPAALPLEYPNFFYPAALAVENNKIFVANNIGTQSVCIITTTHNYI
jgi:hypothetical protein